MFQFTTTTIINKNVDYTTGLPLWSKLEDPASFNVKRHLKFLKENVVALYKAEAYDPILAKATLDLSTITEEEGIFRIAMYIRLSGSMNSYYSNDFVFKGKPLYIEFTKKKGETAAEVAKKVAKIAKKYLVTVYEFDVVNIKAEDTKVIIDAVDEYQRFTKVDVEYYNSEGGIASCCGAFGAYEVVAHATEAGDPEHDGKNIIVQGKEGFGTYTHLIKDHRLPTAANTRWNKIIQDETPILGAKYNQYVIYYAVNRGIMGGDAVGEVTRSKTCHVFFVNQDVAAEFEAALSVLGAFGGRTGNTVPEEAASTAEEALINSQANAKAIENKADAEAVNDAVANLQAQIDEIKAAL